MDKVISDFIEKKLYGIIMQYKSANNVLHYKCEYTNSTSTEELPRTRSKHTSPIVMPKSYSNLDTFLYKIEMNSVSTENDVNILSLAKKNDTFIYKNSLVLTAMIPIDSLDSKQNLLVEHMLSIFNISIQQLVKTATNEIKVINKSKSLSKLLTRLIGDSYTLVHQTSDIRYRRIHILNTTYINMTVGFSYYTNLSCVTKMLFKILYMYNYDLIILKHDNVDYLTYIQDKWENYKKQQLRIISDQILFSSPSKCLPHGGIEFQQAREAYYTNRNQTPPIFAVDTPSFKKKVKRKLQFKNIFNNK